jgi:putative nucleotidyltransferase with HDIG domain
MISALFVDDEPMLLSGLRRLLRPLRDEWRMSFVESADAACALLANEPYDVVVSDIRMPGRSGVDFLTEVAKRWPDTVRIILSGEADLDTACRSVRVSHQFLSKPCDLDGLRATITRACRLKRTIADPELAQFVGALQFLPCIPEVYEELVALLNDPSCSAEAVGRVIHRDISMAASVLRLVNSAYFSLPRLITDAGEAARLLGFDLIKTLVLGVGIFRQFEDLHALDPHVSALCMHSVAVAAQARMVAARLGLAKADCELAGMAGMLHDVGELVLASNHPEVLLETLARSADDGPPLWRLERDALGSSHCEIGAYLLGLWGLHDAVVETAAFHHTPSDLGAGARVDVLTAVHVANHFVAEVERPGSHMRSPLDSAYLDALGVGELVAALGTEQTPQAH